MQFRVPVLAGWLSVAMLCMVYSTRTVAQVAIDPSGSVTLGTASVTPPTTTTVNGDTTVNGATLLNGATTVTGSVTVSGTTTSNVFNLKGSYMGIVVSDFVTGGTATASCYGTTRIVSGAGFFIVPDNRGKDSKSAQGMCGWGVVQCPTGGQFCQIKPDVTQGCSSPNTSKSIAMVQAVCQ